MPSLHLQFSIFYPCKWKYPLLRHHPPIYLFFFYWELLLCTYIYNVYTLCLDGLICNWKLLSIVISDVFIRGVFRFVFVEKYCTLFAFPKHWIEMQFNYFWRSLFFFTAKCVVPFAIKTFSRKTKICVFILCLCEIIKILIEVHNYNLEKLQLIDEENNRNQQLRKIDEHTCQSISYV